MRKTILLLAAVVLVLSLGACSDAAMADMDAVEKDGAYIILWEGRTYWPFCVVSKADCGHQLGFLNGDRDHRVSEYKGYKPEEWLVSWIPVDGGAMLYKEESVTEIPAGLEQEYYWRT